jgi:hypothetical protein
MGCHRRTSTQWDRLCDQYIYAVQEIVLDTISIPMRIA